VASKTNAEVIVRPSTPDDIPVCGQICYQAFRAINEAHGFPPDFPAPEFANRVIAAMFSSPSFYTVVAEVGGRIVGSNALDERSMIRGVGPITVDPNTQNTRVGRSLMRAVMDRAAATCAPGVRLVQAAFHNRSLSLYTSLGFDVREPLSCMQGKTRERSIDGCHVRTAQPSDLHQCNELSYRVHGFDRSLDLEQSIQRSVARVVERGDRITGYSSDLAFSGHSTAETNLDLQALIACVDSFTGPGILVPTRNSALFRWCLANGLRVVQPMTLMTAGLYSEPAGAWLPSILF
jgi:predicted N-acetyltransferase YhbS